MRTGPAEDVDRLSATALSEADPGRTKHPCDEQIADLAEQAARSMERAPPRPAGSHRGGPEPCAARLPGMPSVIPVFPVTDIDRAAAFYVALGFSEDTRAADYLIMIHPLGIELHLHLEGRWGVGGPNHSGAAYIRFTTASEARDLHDTWARTARLSDLHKTHYGQLEFGLVDPFGNTITVGGSTC